MAASPSIARVQEALRAAGLSNEVRELPDSTRSSAEAAAALGCSVAQIAKSVVFRSGSGRPVLVVASGANRVDERKVEALLGDRLLRADAGYVRERTGFAIGGVAPIAHATPPHVFLDEELFAFDRVYAAAGTPFAIFALTPAELEALTGGLRADLRKA
ncbi:MAG: YbaK/EbsC family protein [Alphaproteobacteria bacterium]|jgi:prolyl-tRNA editing enzyme YbaK/EbsC (Cys-tRNA(Pro) deacylase)